MVEDFVLSGGCLCGAVRYRIAGSALQTSHCHCEMCRKTHGALFATYSRVPRDRLTIERGEAEIRDFESSPGIRRSFCRRCGGHLFFARDARPEIVSVAAGTLDSGAHPGHPEGRLHHIFVGSKAPWYPIADGLPQCREYQ